MQNGANKRLANLKTKAETGLDYVMLKLDVISPFGKKKLKAKIGRASCRERV